MKNSTKYNAEIIISGDMYMLSRSTNSPSVVAISIMVAVVIMLVIR